MMARKDALIRLFIERGVLRFGEFTLKSGRQSPYFFNLGALHTGAAMLMLGDAYAESAKSAGIQFDLVFGPAYKGIPLAVATAEALARSGRDVPWAFNRKEAKDHGEGGQFVGAPVAGRVLIVDDVLTAGTAVREATDLIQAAGADIAGVVIALDRQERADGVTSTAVEALRESLGVPVASILTLADILRFLAAGGLGSAADGDLEARIRAYRERYCVLED
ncbi:MAG: orotate phosphoribosyltransferase [Pseudomonadales bacterium]|jgi:orotate phosphoribosyltransferase